MKVKVDINRIDYWNYNKYAMLKVPKLRFNFILNMIAIPVSIFITLLFLLNIPIANVLIITIIGGCIGDLLVINITKWQIMRLPYNKVGLLGEHTIEINEKGVRETTSVNDGFQTWEGIQSVEQDKAYIYIFLDSILAHIIPKIAFNSIAEANEFFNKSVEFWKKERNM